MMARKKAARPRADRLTPSSTTGPVKAPETTISYATAAPMLKPTTRSAPALFASSAVIRAIVLGAVVLRRRCAGVPWHRDSDQPGPGQRGLGHHLGVRTRAAHAAWKQQHCVLSVTGTGLDHLPRGVHASTLGRRGRPVMRHSPQSHW